MSDISSDKKIRLRDYIITTKNAEITALRAEVELLNAMNALMSYAARPSDEDAREAEEWLAANPGAPLSDYCPAGGLLVKQLCADIETLKAHVQRLKTSLREYEAAADAPTVCEGATE